METESGHQFFYTYIAFTIRNCTIRQRRIVRYPPVTWSNPYTGGGDF